MNWDLAKHSNYLDFGKVGDCNLDEKRDIDRARLEDQEELKVTRTLGCPFDDAVGGTQQREASKTKSVDYTVLNA